MLPTNYTNENHQQHTITTDDSSKIEFLKHGDVLLRFRRACFNVFIRYFRCSRLAAVFVYFFSGNFFKFIVVRAYVAVLMYMYGDCTAMTQRGEYNFRLG